MMDTPVPIPNTEVKHHRGEDSTLCENSSLPVPSFFLCLYMILDRSYHCGMTFFLICFIASYKIKIILSCYYLMFINFLKLFEYLDFLYELLLEISKKKTSFRGLYYYIFTVDLTNSTTSSEVAQSNAFSTKASISAFDTLLINFL